MAEASSPMEIDSAAPTPSALEKVNKGKSLVVSDGKSAPWVEKYRPQSLADVAAHRDIVDTSTYTLFFISAGNYRFGLLGALCGISL
jgi:hypothetical protein